MDGDPLRTLRDLGRQRREARATLARLRPHLHEAVRAAHTAGIPVTEIARAAGMTRPAVYALLRGSASSHTTSPAS